ncbi:MAG: hypothetical protein AAGB34_05410 [Planctomycetota bacterium]
MPGRARVSDLEVIGTVRAACIRFSEESQAALVAGGSDATKTLAWLQRQQLPHWKRQIRIRSEEAVRAKTKFVQQSSGPSPRPSVDARLEYEKAKRLVREAEEKYESTRRCIRMLEREIERYRASVQPMAAIARGLSNHAAGRLDAIADALQAYTDERPARSGDNPGQSSASQDLPGEAGGEEP